MSQEINCHKGEWNPFAGKDYRWEVIKPDGCYGANLRHCPYCGGIHPKDAFELLKSGANLELADMKYGWPHKFYIDGVPNPLAGQIVKIGSRSGADGKGGYFDEDIVGPAPKTLQVKFYNTHLNDFVDEPELFQELIAKLYELSGIKFGMRDGRLYYKM